MFSLAVQLFEVAICRSLTTFFLWIVQNCPKIVHICYVFETQSNSRKRLKSRKQSWTSQFQASNILILIVVSPNAKGNTSHAVKDWLSCFKYTTFKTEKFDSCLQWRLALLPWTSLHLKDFMEVVCWTILDNS